MEMSHAVEYEWRGYTAYLMNDRRHDNAAIRQGEEGTHIDRIDIMWAVVATPNDIEHIRRELDYATCCSERGEVMEQDRWPD